MANKIFITYKYGDTGVQRLGNIQNTTARTYVDALQHLLKDDHINKGEMDGQSLADFEDETIASNLRDKIFDSSLSIVLISPNMKNPYVNEGDQWIPWEVSYSLKEHTRDGRTSLTNALLAVTLPDVMGSYNYFIAENSCNYCNCRTLQTDTLFRILRENMFNIKKPTHSDCQYHADGNQPYIGYSSYIHTAKWSDFIANPNKYIDIAYEINSKIDQYNIVKQMPSTKYTVLSTLGSLNQTR